MSCSKSVTSAVIGIAINQGAIQSVDESIFNYLPDHQEFKTSGKENITIEHLLTMTGGLNWNEWVLHGTSANDIDRIYLECQEDPIKCVLEHELIHKPGEHFTYNGGGIIILGEIIKNATGMNFEDFAHEHLFGPLGIDSVEMYQFENGVYATDGSINITPRDMLKFGILFLNNGMWNDSSVIQEDWIVKSSTNYKNNVKINAPIEDSGKNGYSYTWWTSELKFQGKTIHAYRANGWGGQVIMVIPDLDMVIVTTAGNYAFRSKFFKLVKKYILASIKKDL